MDAFKSRKLSQACHRLFSKSFAAKILGGEGAVHWSKQHLLNPNELSEHRSGILGIIDNVKLFHRIFETLASKILPTLGTWMLLSHAFCMT